MSAQPSILRNTETPHVKKQGSDSARDPDVITSSGPDAPGGPGDPPTWTCAAKSGIGCALSPDSHVWFTLGRGILNEVYFPQIDRAALRDLRLIVTDSSQFFCDEEHDTLQNVRLAAPGVPLYLLANTCKRGKFRIEKEVLADPRRDVLLHRVRFVPLQGSLGDYRLYVVLSPRLGDQGRHNSASLGEYNGRPMLLAEHDGDALALGCSAPWGERSVGYAGTSDPLNYLREHKRITRSFARANNGHVILAGKVDLSACGGEFLLALGFDRSPDAAALTANLSLLDDFATARKQYVDEWANWQQSLVCLESSASATVDSRGWAKPDRSRPAVPPGEFQFAPDLCRTSLMVLRAHRSLHFPGAGVASLTVPWGEARGDGDLGGYHLVWVRDLFEEAMGLLAVGANEDARRIVSYLRATQHSDGHWPQDMWLDGSAYMNSVQMDEVALPILLVDHARRLSVLSPDDCRRLWPMVLKAAGYLVSKGPATQQERWENTPGYSPYTLATEVAGLLAAADLADLFAEPGLARKWRETADHWNESIEHWTYVTGTNLARRVGVDGYYVRIAPPDLPASQSRDVPEESAHRLPVTEVVSPDALALVRFGLRAANDPRIVNTIKAIDAATKVETPFGPCWHRYNGDYYGEHDDGSPYEGHGDTAGRGRAWPLLTGERGHYEVAAGRIPDARRMLAAMASFASAVGLLPEQVWDAPDLPQKHLHCGRPSDSAMPLAWAHAEYVRLLRSVRDGRVFDMPPQPYERYVRRSTSK